MSTKTSKFVQTVLKSLNKTEKELQQEKVTTFVEDSVIDCRQQISTLETSVIPSLKLKLERQQTSLEKAKKNYENVRFSIANTFQDYVANRENALDRIDFEQEAIRKIEQELAQEEKQLKGFKDILADLTA